MKRFLWLLIAAAVVAGTMLGGPTLPAQAAKQDHAVFVQTNNSNGNSIVAFRRNADGTLTPAATYPTGGKGGRADGAASDPLASQGSLVFDPADGLLFAVNAGSNTVSVFGVKGDQLHLNQVISSGGSFPVGFALRGSLLYVLNAGLASNVSGFRIADDRLHPIKGSTRSLGLANSNPPFFLSTPAQVGFTPSGSQLVVTTKTNATVDVFSVSPNGLLSAQPVKSAVAGAPFTFRFDASGHLVLVNAGDNSVGIYTVNADNTLTVDVAPVSDTQKGSCWITTVAGYDYVANTGSGTISQYSISDAAVELKNAAAASGIAGPTDMTTAGGFLYNQAGLSSSVDVFAVNVDGSLTLIQTQLVPEGVSQEGIVAT